MYKKLILGAVLTVTYAFSFAQDTQQKLTIGEDRRVSNYGFTEDGSFYMKTSKRVLSAKAKDAEFIKYNAKTLEVDYTYKPDGNFFIKETSPEGDAILFDDSKGLLGSFVGNKYNVLHQNGNVKKFEGKDWVPEDFIVISDYISKDYYAALGYLKGRKNFKKGKNKEYKLFRRDLKTFKSITTNFNLAAIEIEDQSKDEGKGKKKKDEEVKLTYQIIENTNESFTLLSKQFFDFDEKDKNARTQAYYLKTYDYDGTLIQEHTLKTKIDNAEMNYQFAYTDGDAYKIVYTTYVDSKGNTKTRTRYYPRPKASGNVLIDRENKFFYTWGIVASKKSKSGSGFIISKFDFDGVQLWSKTEKAFPDLKDDDIRGPKTNIRLVDAGDNLGLSIYNKKEDFTVIYQFDKSNCNIIEKKEFGDYKYIMGMVGKQHFVSSYKFKDNFSKKYTLDMNSVIGYTLNKNFKKFVDSFSGTKKQLNFISSINKNGVVTIFADNKEQDFRLLKFDWN